MKVVKSTGGFTAIEIAIVVLVSGLLFSAFFRLYENYLLHRDYRTTIENINLAQDALGEFFGLNGRYPCPADPTLPPGDPDYGIEQCRADWLTDPCPNNLTCLNVDSRDADGDGVDDPVVIGTLPSVTLAENAVEVPFVTNKGLDGYNMKLAYAVSENMTDQGLSVYNPANSNLGAIEVKDKNGRSAVVPEASAHYVIYSTGENNLGGFTRNGDSIGGCVVTSTTNPIPPGFNPGMAGIEVEKENCDNNDAVFVKELHSLVDSDDYYDDILFVGISNMSSLWRRSLYSPPTDTYLYNTNLGSVGIGNSNPSSDLHVMGNVRTETQTQSDDYCNLTRDDCVDPDFLGGAGFQCPNGQAATGIEENRLVCAPIFTAPINFTCPPGEFVTSFSNLGNRNCAAP